MTTTRTIVAAACALLLAACGKGSKSSGSDAGCVPFDAGTASSALVQQGLSIIEQRSCQQCHGGLLSGNNDGVNVPGTNIIQYPPNLSSDPATGLGCWTDDQIVRAILYGIDNEGAVMCPPMPQWADAGMTDSDARAVVAFLRTLPPVVNNVDQGPSCTCTTTSDCGNAALTCVNQICEPGVSLPGDAGPSDAGSSDAGPSDAGNSDAGSFDAGDSDAGSFDAGNSDAGSFDAGNSDAGSFDAGNSDAGTFDAGDSDAGSFDAGNSDAGTLDAGDSDAGSFDAGDDSDAGDSDAGSFDAGDDSDAGDSDAGSLDAGDSDAGSSDAGAPGRRPRLRRSGYSAQ